jgi:glycine C-acetyltransferase
MGKEAALVFPTGYDAIVAVPQSLLTPQDRAIVDGSSHASILEGAQSSGAVIRVFGHNDASRLEQTLKRSRESAPHSGLLVMIEGAYSMDGDIANLPEIVAVCRKYDARLLVDEAHAIGVYGENGHGVCEHFGLSREVDFIAGTFSKSLGAVGGFVAADEAVILYLRYMCRRSVFSAALPPMILAGVLCSLDIIEQDRGLRNRLWENVRYLRAGLAEAGAKLLGFETASVPVLIGNDSIVFRFTEDMIAEGVFTFPAVYPTVPKDRSLLRLAVQSRHEQAHLDHAIEVLSRLLRKYGLTQ